MIKIQVIILAFQRRQSWWRRILAIVPAVWTACAGGVGDHEAVNAGAVAAGSRAATAAAAVALG